MKIVSTKVHTIIGIVVALALLAAPWLFGFAELSGAASAVAIGVGLFILVSELTTTSPLSPIKMVPMSFHIVIDVLTGIFLLVSPLLFGFIDASVNAWLPHVVVGALVAGYALVTSTVDEKKPTVAHI